MINYKRIVEKLITVCQGCNIQLVTFYFQYLYKNAKKKTKKWCAMILPNSNPKWSSCQSLFSSTWIALLPPCIKNVFPSYVIWFRRFPDIIQFLIWFLLYIINLIWDNEGFYFMLKCQTDWTFRGCWIVSSFLELLTRATSRLSLSDVIRTYIQTYCTSLN